MFITFEGLDFCGKSTQVKLLSDHLLLKNKRVEVIREPGGTEISEKIRTILLDNTNSKMFEETELLLFSASRSQLVNEKILNYLESGYYVISDRFHDSSIAYQGYGRGLPIEFITELQSFVIKAALPDITFFIDLPLNEIRKRRLKVGNTVDRIESSKEDFYLRVRKGYHELAAGSDRFRIIEGLKSKEEIHKIVIDEIENYEKRIGVK